MGLVTFSSLALNRLLEDFSECKSYLGLSGRFSSDCQLLDSKVLSQIVPSSLFTSLILTSRSSGMMPYAQLSNNYQPILTHSRDRL